MDSLGFSCPACAPSLQRHALNGLACRQSWPCLGLLGLLHIYAAGVVDACSTRHLGVDNWCAATAVSTELMMHALPCLLPVLARTDCNPLCLQAARPRTLACCCVIPPKSSLGLECPEFELRAQTMAECKEARNVHMPRPAMWCPWLLIRAAYALRRQLQWPALPVVLLPRQMTTQSAGQPITYPRRGHST